MILLNWNLEWADATTLRGKSIRRIIQGIDPDILCLTETTQSLLPTHGHALFATCDHGYKHPPLRRKVALWSKTPWSEIDDIGHPDLPGGRYISAVTAGIRFIGICIPWKDAHVSTGNRNRRQWEDHLTFLNGLSDIFAHDPKPICVIGDFNQRIPRIGQPTHVFDALTETFRSFEIPTAGLLDPDQKPLIDHFAIRGISSFSIREIIPKTGPDGSQLTDHAGIIADLEL